LSRGASFGISLPFLFVSTGIAFNMLKLIDVYYFVYYAETKIDPLVFIHYMLFLPVFTSGPIFRYRDFQKTYRDPLPLTGAEFTDGFKRVLRGLFKKVVLAAWLQTLLAWLLTSSGHWYISCLAVLCSYGILYFDLSGYSDIAIAFSRMAGFDAPENFKKPWAAPSFTQFWRSWHATLSDWIREHIFVVVRGKKLSRYFTAALAFTAMLVMGLWHGFQIPYLIAGCYNGLLLAGENILSLTTVNRRKVKRSTFILRCAAINFLFGLNTLVFTMPSEKVLFVLRSFLRL
jgi:alginate O-acetyltransferase complex protein AlgI